jgi:hypothetical protein
VNRHGIEGATVTALAFLSLIFLGGCPQQAASSTAVGGGPGDGGTVTIPSSTASSGGGGGQGTSAAPGAASCASQQEGAAPSCKWTLGKTRYCGGAPPPPQVLAQYGKDVCVCNECLADGDCPSNKPGVKCKTIQAYACDAQAEQRCVYPGDPCYDDSCPSGTMCLLDGPGKTKCGAHEPPRP